MTRFEQFMEMLVQGMIWKSCQRNSRGSAVGAQCNARRGRTQSDGRGNPSPRWTKVQTQEGPPDDVQVAVGLGLEGVVAKIGEDSKAIG